MRIPQELVDAVIDCIGADRAEDFFVGQLFQSAVSEDERAQLKSLALASRACNHRARSYLFARCNVVNSDPGAVEGLGQCPDALLKYIRVLTIRCGENPATTLATLRRFISSPLVSIRLFSMHVPEELPELLKSLFPNVHRVIVVASMLSAAAALNLVSILEHTSELRLNQCHFTPLGRNDSLPTLPPLQGRLVLSESHPPHSAITSLLSRIPLPLRSLSHDFVGLPSENKLIEACGGSLEILEVRMLASLANSGSTPDLGPCVNLQHIIFFITSGHGGKVITHLSGLLSTLRDHRLTNIQLAVGSPAYPGPGPQERDLLVQESWGRLDQVLYKLGGQAQGRGEILTFQIASVVALTKQTLAGLLPRFSETGISEGVVL